MLATATTDTVCSLRAHLQAWKFHAALTELAAFIAPARVVAYPSTLVLAAAVLQQREPLAHVLVHADAAKITRRESRSLAAQAVEEGGLAFRLTNRGPRKAAILDCWRHRVAAPTSTAAAFQRARAGVRPEEQIFQPAESDALLDTLMDAVPIVKDPSSTFAAELCTVEPTKLATHTL